MDGLKLLALDIEDLAVISAHVQDAVSKPSMLEYAAKTKQFSLVLNRFAWDVGNKKRSTYERRGSVLSFARVHNVKTLGIRRGDEAQVLSLLTVKFSPTDLPAGKIDLIFADGLIVQLDVECVEVRLDDLGSAWETKFKPRHPLA
ncbi:MAG: DUF2948 family protein [Ahrensia sp.]|nr:DUF2948 family protein [Ahrensia sp.]